MFKRTASAVWQGDLKNGKGTVSSENGALKDTPYAFVNRFDSTPGTNPEELIAAAHAACFSMAFSHGLAGAGHTPDSVATTASATFEQVDGQWTISKIHLETTAKVPGIDQAKFDSIAAESKAGCPVSRALKAEITLSAKLE